MDKVYVGSLNQVKIKAVAEVLKDYEVKGFGVDSKVSCQPLTDEETINGAKNRALALPRDGLRIGLEAGVQITNDIMFLTNWGVLIDENDNYYYAGGTRIALPEFVKEKILTKKYELAEVMDEYFNTFDIKHHNGAIGVFTNDYVKRIDIFIHITKLLYGQYTYYCLNKKH